MSRPYLFDGVARRVHGLAQLAWVLPACLVITVLGNLQDRGPKNI